MCQGALCASSWQHPQGPLWLLLLILFSLAQHWSDIQVRTIKNIHWSLTWEYPKYHFSFHMAKQIMWGKNKAKCLRTTLTCRPVAAEEADTEPAVEDRCVLPSGWGQLQQVTWLSFSHSMKRTGRVSSDSDNCQKRWALHCLILSLCKITPVILKPSFWLCIHL